MCVTLLGRPYDKIRKTPCQYSWQFQKKNVIQRGLDSHRPHGTRPGLKTILCQTCDKIVCTFQIKFIFLLLYLLSFFPPFFCLSYFLPSFCRSSFSYLHFSYCATNRKVAGSIPDDVIGIFRWHNPSVRTMTVESTQSLKKWVLGGFPGG